MILATFMEELSGNPEVFLEIYNPYTRLQQRAGLIKRKVLTPLEMPLQGVSTSRRARSIVRARKSMLCFVFIYIRLE